MPFSNIKVTKNAFDEVKSDKFLILSIFIKKSKQIGLVLTKLGQFEEIRSKFWDFSKNNHSF
jgi:hypothetical protein